MKKPTYAALEKRILKLEAQLGSMARTLTKVTHERDVARLETQQERLAHAETRRRMQQLIEAVECADERLKALIRRQFGAASEQLHVDQHYIAECMDALDDDTKEALTELKHLVGADSAQLQDAADQEGMNEKSSENTSLDEAAKSSVDQKKRSRKRPDGSGGRKPLPADIERRPVDYQPPADHPALRGATHYDIINSTTFERLTIPKLTCYVEEVTCPVAKVTYGKGSFARTMQVTLSPPSVLARSQVADNFVIESACDKINEHLPSYRQSARLAEMNLDIPRSKLCRWHIALATCVRPIAEAILHDIRAERVVGIDDTVHRLLSEGACHNGRLWAVCGQSGYYYQFHRTREGQWIENMLEQYAGGVMGDAYGGHKKLLERNNIIALFCWAHVRRKFFESRACEKRTVMLSLIGKLYDIEDAISDQPPDERLALRQQQSIPILNTIKTKLDTWDADPRVLPKTGIGKSVTYALKLWDGLIAYTTCAYAPIDNNHCERGMRKNALHRKNSLFSASIDGAEAYATLLTVMQSARLHDLNTRQYLKDVVEDLHYNRRSPAQLTPQQYAKRVKAGVTQPS